MDGLDTRACARPRRQLRPRQHAVDAGSLRQLSRGGGVHRRRRGRRGRRRRRGPRRLRLAGPALLRPGTEGQQRHAASRTCVVQSRVRPHAEDEARPPLPRLLRPRLKIPPSAEGEVTWPEPAARTTRHRMRMRFCLAPGFAWRVNRSCVGLAMHAASAVIAQLSVLNCQCSTVSAQPSVLNRQCSTVSAYRQCSRGVGVSTCDVPSSVVPVLANRDIGIPEDQLIIDIAQVSLDFTTIGSDNLRAAVCVRRAARGGLRVAVVVRLTCLTPHFMFEHLLSPPSASASS